MALASQREGFLTLLKKKNFVRIWLAQLISLTVFNASNYGLLILIENITGSTTLVALAIICFSLPAVLFGAPAGVFVDHMNKRRVLWGSNCLRAIASFIFVISLLISHHLLLPVYLLTFLISLISQFFTPAEGSTIPMLVSEEELMPALSLFNITFMLSQALGYTIFGAAALLLLPTFKLFGLTIDSIVQLYVIAGLLYLVCAQLIALIPQKSFVQKSQPGQKTGPVASETLGILNSVWNETRQGWSFVRGNKQLFLAVVQLSFAGVLLLLISLLAPTIVTKLLGFPASTMAFVFAPAGIGLVAGSILMPRITKRLGRGRTVFIGILIMTAATALVPLCTFLMRLLNPQHWNGSPILLSVIAFLMLMAGFGLDCVNIPAQTEMQELSPDWIKGRVLALQLVLYNAVSIPVLLFVGAISDIFGVDRVLYLMAAFELAFGLWGLYYARKHPPQPPLKLEMEVEVIEEQYEADEIMPLEYHAID
jgi:MFS family permease